MFKGKLGLLLNQRRQVMDRRVIRKGFSVSTNVGFLSGMRSLTWAEFYK